MKITPQSLCDVLVGNLTISADMPSDTRLVSSWRDEAGNYVFLFESSSWEHGHEGEIIDEAEFTITRHE